MLFCSLKKGLSPKIRMLCFVIIKFNTVPLNPDWAQNTSLLTYLLTYFWTFYVFGSCKTEVLSNNSFYLHKTPKEREAIKMNFHRKPTDLGPSHHDGNMCLVDSDPKPSPWPVRSWDLDNAKGHRPNASKTPSTVPTKIRLRRRRCRWIGW